MNRLPKKMRALAVDDYLMTREEFMSSVKANNLIDYDGFGELATACEVSSLAISPGTAKAMAWPDWATHVCWYNK